MNSQSLCTRMILVLATLSVPVFGAVRGEEHPNGVLRFEADPNSGRGLPVDIDSLVTAVKNRVRRAADVRAVGDKQLEVKLSANVNAAERERIKKLLIYTGVLEFRILADTTYAADESIIKQATSLLPNQRVVQLNGGKVAEWISASEGDEGLAGKQDTSVVKRVVNGKTEVLVLSDSYNVTGDYLTAANVGTSDRNVPVVHFSLNQAGAKRLEKLTRENVPSPAAPGSYRRLGLILDKHLVSAPTIRTAISNHVAIGGGAMTKRDADTIVEILNAGTLPYSIHLVEEEPKSPEK